MEEPHQEAQTTLNDQNLQSETAVPLDEPAHEGVDAASKSSIEMDSSGFADVDTQQDQA